jgi:hypothetical protein
LKPVFQICDCIFSHGHASLSKCGKDRINGALIPGLLTRHGVIEGCPGRQKGSRNLLAEALIDDLYEDWKEHGMAAIRAVREERPADYLKIVAMLVSKCEDLSLDSDMRDAAVEQFIEERRQQALKMIAKMEETE